MTGKVEVDRNKPRSRALIKLQVAFKIGKGQVVDVITREIYKAHTRTQIPSEVIRFQRQLAADVNQL